MLLSIDWQLFTGKEVTTAAAVSGQPAAVHDAYSLVHRERDKGRPLTIHITQPAGTPSGLSLWHFVGAK